MSGGSAGDALGRIKCRYGHLDGQELIPICPSTGQAPVVVKLAPPRSSRCPYDRVHHLQNQIDDRRDESRSPAGRNSEAESLDRSLLMTASEPDFTDLLNFVSSYTYRAEHLP